MHRVHAQIAPPPRSYILTLTGPEIDALFGNLTKEPISSGLAPLADKIRGEVVQQNLAPPTPAVAPAPPLPMPPAPAPAAKPAAPAPKPEPSAALDDKAIGVGGTPKPDQPPAMAPEKAK